MLDKQVSIYSCDTGDFYSNTEARLHNLNHKVRYERKVLLSELRKLTETLKENGFDDEKLELIWKTVKEKDYDISDEIAVSDEIVNCDNNEIKNMIVKYVHLNRYIEHKRKIANGYKEKLWELLANKVEANIKTNGTHHIRKLNKEHLSDNRKISVFISSFIRMMGISQNEFTENFLVVQVYYFDIIKDLILHGFEYKGERYIFYTASAGQIRTKKTVFVKESEWYKYEKTIMCGLTLDIINAKGGNNPNKHLAYMALSNSATDLWKDFDIDKTIVIDDFETQVFGTYDLIDDADYSIKRISGYVPITHTDGAGMILNGKNRMVRLPWIKGLLGHFDFVSFINEHNCPTVIKDIYSQEHDIIKEDIQIIFTKSQFKMWKYYDTWEQYKECYKKYNCTAGYANIESDKIKNTTINYQMLQTLVDYTDYELKEIAVKSIDKLTGLCKSIDSMKRAFGVTVYNTDKTYLQKCIDIYPDLMTDRYMKRRLKEIKDNLVKRSRAGHLDVNGKYTFILPDFYAACEYWFKGKGYGRLTDWVDNGLDVTNQKIVNEVDNNVMSWDAHGILMREYDPVTETYANKQVKITNKGLYVTDDAWESAKVGVGNFIYYDPKEEEYYETFGVIADTLVGNLILSKEVGIYSEKNDITLNDSGIIISNAPYAEYSTTGETKIVINPNSDSPFRITHGTHSVIRVDNDGTLYINRKLNVHDAFKVNNSGDIDMDGDITMDGNIYIKGNITWGNETGVIQTLYSSQEDKSAPTHPYSYYSLTSSSGDSSWHRQFTPSRDKCIARYIYDEENDEWAWYVENITFLTHIDAGGIYTGTVVADNVQTGVLSTKSFTKNDANNDYGYMELYKQMIFFNENDADNTKGDTKMAIGFLKGSQYNEPIIVMGAGDGSGSNVAYINKGGSEFDIIYKVNSNTAAYMKMYGAAEASTGTVAGTVRINGVNFPPQASDMVQFDMIEKANYWNKKLDAIKETVRGATRSVVREGDGTLVSIPPENLGELFIVEGTTIKLNPNVVLSWNAVYALYGKNAYATPTNAYSTYPNTSSTGWHKTLDTTNDYYASYSYDGGNTWSAAIKVQGSDGSDGADGHDGADGTVNYNTIYTHLEEIYGIEYTTIGKSYISSPEINGATIYGGNIYGGTFYAMGSTSASGITGKRIQINSNGIKSYDAQNRLHGVVIDSDSLTSIQFYYQGEVRGTLQQLGGSFQLFPLNTGSLVIGALGKSTFAHGTWDFSNATVTGLSGSMTPKFG